MGISIDGGSSFRDAQDAGTENRNLVDDSGNDDGVEDASFRSAQDVGTDGPTIVDDDGTDDVDLDDDDFSADYFADSYSGPKSDEVETDDDFSLADWIASTFDDEDTSVDDADEADDDGFSLADWLPDLFSDDATETPTAAEVEDAAALVEQVQDIESQMLDAQARFDAAIEEGEALSASMGFFDRWFGEGRQQLAEVNQRAIQARMEMIGLGQEANAVRMQAMGLDPQTATLLASAMVVGGVKRKGATPKWGNWKSEPTYGHTFNTHGAGNKNLNKLRGRAAKAQRAQGQWTDNQAAADFLAGLRLNARPGTGVRVSIPEGLGRVVRPDGSTAAAGNAIVVMRPNGTIKTAYPVLD